MDYCAYGSVRDLMVVTDYEFHEEEVAFVMSEVLRGLVGVYVVFFLFVILFYLNIYSFFFL
jgi:hypothetical protein